MSSASVSVCHTKVTCVVDLEAVVLIVAEVHIKLFCILWLFFAVFRGCLGTTHLGFIVHGSCVMHWTPHRHDLCPHLSQASGPFDPNVGCGCWL